MTASAASVPLKEDYIHAYKWMLLARTLEDRIAGLYRAGGKIVGGVYLGRGQEAFSAALGISLEKGDIFGPLIRDMAGRLAFGEPLLDAPRTYLGSALGPMKGRDGNIHRGRPAERLPAMISHLGSLVSVVTGMLLARRLKGEPLGVGATAIGDGGMSTGSFHEAMNVAAVEGLPLVVAVADNAYAYSTPTSRQFACDTLVDRAAGYGVCGKTVDGTDLSACLSAFQGAVARARSGEGPQMVVGRLLRLSGHGEHDDATYVSAKERTEPRGRDCLPVSEAHIRSQDWASETELEHWKADCRQSVAEAIATAQNEPGPDAIETSWAALASEHLVEGICG